MDRGLIPKGKSFLNDILYIQFSTVIVVDYVKTMGL